MATRSRYRSFTAKEKLRIIEEAENVGNRLAGRKYDVSESCIRDWRKKTKRDLQRIVGLIVGHFAARKRGIRNLKKRLCDYVDDKRVSKVHCISVKKHLASGCRQLVADRHGMATANHAYSTCTSR